MLIHKSKSTFNSGELELFATQAPSSFSQCKKYRRGNYALKGQVFAYSKCMLLN